MKKEKKAASKKTIGIIIGAVAVAIALGVIVIIGMGRDFDAQKYVNVILDYTFKGKADGAEELFEEDSIAQLQKQYEENMNAFVERNVTGKIEVEPEMKEKYTALCQDIFQAMKYDVKEAERVNGDEYKVTVEYQVANVFPAYKESASKEAAGIMERVQKGEYQGTTEDINLQMQKDTINNNYELLKAAYENVQYGEKESMVFTIKRDENETFALDSAKLSEFLVKILDLDRIQD